MGVDGRAAAQTLLSFGSIKPGLCLYYVWQAYKAHGATANGTWPTAYSAWIDTPGKHEGDRNPPAGVPVWFGPKSSSNAGDVVISLGDGRVACTDWPVYGQVGSCTIDERQRQIGRPYLGWTETILGAPIDFASAAPANLSSGQRTAKTIVNRRLEPSSQSAIAGDPLQPGAVGNFTGWIRGENVEGNNVWYQGVSGNWFWSGGFHEGANGTGLSDLNPKPIASNERTVGPGGQANGRTGPGRSFPVAQTLDPGTVGTFNGWANGEAVEGVDVWFRGAFSGNWFWAGGFTSRSTEGLPQVTISTTPTAPTTPTTPATPPATTDPNNPRGLPKYTPVYPGAAFALDAPLGDGLRGTKGEPPVTVPVIIDRAIEHHTGVLPDQLDWFSYKNSRSSCPNWFIRPDGTVIELIRPGRKPALTGPEWNWRSVGWEIQTTNLTTFEGTPQQFEAVCQLLAWLRSKDGTVLDGAPVTFKLTREYFINHREAIPGTECPGNWWASKMDAQLERALAIFDEKYAPAPEPTPEPEPDTVAVPRTWLQSVLDKLKALLGGGS